jgi:hypothetical protein
LLALSATVVGCTQSEGLPHVPTSGPATLTIRSHVAPGGPVYIEGALPQVVVRQSDGSVAAWHRAQPLVTDEFPLSDLEPGDYVLHAGLRPCDANCDNLDPPTNTCRTPLHLFPGPWTVQITFGTGRACEIQVSSPGYAAPAGS